MDGSLARWILRMFWFWISLAVPKQFPWRNTLRPNLTKWKQYPQQRNGQGMWILMSFISIWIRFIINSDYKVILFGTYIKMTRKTRGVVYNTMKEEQTWTGYNKISFNQTTILRVVFTNWKRLQILVNIRVGKTHENGKNTMSPKKYSRCLKEKQNLTKIAWASGSKFPNKKGGHLSKEKVIKIIIFVLVVNNDDTWRGNIDFVSKRGNCILIAFHQSRIFKRRSEQLRKFKDGETNSMDRMTIQ